MKDVQGVGGVFLYADDAAALAGWYREHLGVETTRWGEVFGVEFPSLDLEPSARKATTTFSIFQAEQPLPAVRTGRVNLRVADLDGLLTRLERAGLSVERSDDVSYGRFAWVRDREDNRVELWEPLPEEGE